jgi:hypothetical protein
MVMCVRQAPNFFNAFKRNTASRHAYGELAIRIRNDRSLSV